MCGRGGVPGRRDGLPVFVEPDMPHGAGATTFPDPELRRRPEIPGGSASVAPGRRKRPADVLPAGRHPVPRRTAIERGLFAFSSLEQLQGLQTFFGLQFENLVLNHAGDLFPLLGLDRSLVLSAFPYVQPATKRMRGCQIDLLVQTQRTLIVVEIKRRKEIGREIVDEVSEKVSRLARDKSLSVRTALVYDGRLSPGVEADRFFDFVVPAEKLFA